MGFRVGNTSKPQIEDVKPVKTEIVEIKEEKVVNKQAEIVGTTVSENKINDTKPESWRIYHKWFAKDDLKQDMVRYAYKLWWMDLVKTIECENGNRDIHAIGDNGHAFGLCQVNNRFHVVSALYKTSWQAQVEKCDYLLKHNTTFYWPTRIVKGQKCYAYVSDRFYFE